MIEPAHTPSGRAATLERLRHALRRLEGRGGAVASTGMAAIDAALPGGGLRLGALHEILAGPDQMAAAEGFAATLVAGLARPGSVLWCRPAADLYGHGLARLGLTPERLLLVRAARAASLLWAMEEGLRAGGLAAVLGQVPGLDLTAGRRLQLAAEATDTPCLVLGGMGGATAAATRWHIETAPGEADPRDFGTIRPRWRVTLTRCHGAVPQDEAGFGQWLVDEGGGAEAVFADIRMSRSKIYANDV